MEARFVRVLRVLALFLVLGLVVDGQSHVDAAGYKTTNFVVSAPTPQLAKELGDAAEQWRSRLAIEWLGKELPTWSKPCPIHARIATGAGGATSFVFDRGEVFGWRMNIQGSRERMLDSVLPHEITHTVFASHFRQPLPRWADEGACTTVEHPSEVSKQERMLISFLKTGRGIPFDEMFAMKEYPEDVMPLYSQGHSTSQWLIESRGRQVFLDFLADGLGDGDWRRAVRQHYGFDNLLVMQMNWLQWVKEGRPRLTPETSPIAQLIAQRDGLVSVTSRGAADQAIYRGQSPDGAPPAALSAPMQTGFNRGIEPAAHSAGESVYAAAAARAQAEHEAGTISASSAAAERGGSVYDASLDPGTIRR